MEKIGIRKSEFVTKTLFLFQDSLDTSSQNPSQNSTAEIVPSSEDSPLASDVIVGVVKSMGQVCIGVFKSMGQVYVGVFKSMGQVSIELLSQSARFVLDLLSQWAGFELKLLSQWAKFV